MVKLLLRRGALVNLANIHSQTALMDLVHHARDEANLWEVYELLASSSGGDLNLHLTNCSQNHALDLALMNGRVAIANHWLELPKAEAGSKVSRLLPTTVAVKPLPLRHTDYESYNTFRY